MVEKVLTAKAVGREFVRQVRYSCSLQALWYCNFSTTQCWTNSRNFCTASTALTRRWFTVTLMYRHPSSDRSRSESTSVSSSSRTATPRLRVSMPSWQSETESSCRSWARSQTTPRLSDDSLRHSFSDLRNAKVRFINFCWDYNRYNPQVLKQALHSTFTTTSSDTKRKFMRNKLQSSKLNTSLSQFRTVSHIITTSKHTVTLPSQLWSRTSKISFYSIITSKSSASRSQNQLMKLPNQSQSSSL